MLTFRKKLTKLCDRQRNRVYQGKLNPYWCLKYHGECSSKTCRLGNQKMTIKEAYDKGFRDHAIGIARKFEEMYAVPRMISEKTPLNQLVGYDPPKEQDGDEPQEKQ